MQNEAEQEMKPVGVISEDDKKVLAKIKRITARGHDAEIRRKKDGTLTIYEVKKNAVS